MKPNSSPPIATGPLPYHATISLFGRIGAIVGFIVGLVGLAAFAIKNPPGSFLDFVELVLGVIFSATVFWGIGFALACGFAPRDYLESHEGRARLSKIGVKSTVAARLVCASYILFIVAVAAFIGIAAFR